LLSSSSTTMMAPSAYQSVLPPGASTRKGTVLRSSSMSLPTCPGFKQSPSPSKNLYIFVNFTLSPTTGRRVVFSKPNFTAHRFASHLEPSSTCGLRLPLTLRLPMCRASQRPLESPRRHMPRSVASAANSPVKMLPAHIVSPPRNSKLSCLVSASKWPTTFGGAPFAGNIGPASATPETRSVCEARASLPFAAG